MGKKETNFTNKCLFCHLEKAYISTDAILLFDGMSWNLNLLFCDYGNQGKTLSCVHKIVGHNLALTIIAQNHEIIIF